MANAHLSQGTKEIFSEYCVNIRLRSSFLKIYAEPSKSFVLALVCLRCFGVVRGLFKEGYLRSRQFVRIAEHFLKGYEPKA